MLDPAPPSEGGRGDAVAGRDPGAAPRDDVGGRRRRARGRLHQRRHDRVPARRGRPVLLPRDEHAAAGRASDHRDGDRRRSRALADPHRAGRAARPRSGAAAARPTATRSSAGSTPRIRTTVSSRRRAAFSQLRAPAGPGHPRRQRRDRRARRADLLRPDDLQARSRGPRIGPPRSRACAARSASTSVAGIKTTLPFFTWLLEQPDFVAGRFHTTYLDEVLAGAERPAVRRADDGDRGRRGDRAPRCRRCFAGRLRRRRGRTAQLRPSRPALEGRRPGPKGFADCATKSRSTDASGR